jgi:hypothetical protein
MDIKRVPKFYFTSLSISGEMDGCIRDQIFSRMESASAEECDYVALAITHQHDWDFNTEEFERIKSKPFVVFDFTEYGWENVKVKHIFGINTEDVLGMFQNKNYMKLDLALKQVTIRRYFKRELQQGHESEAWLSPIEYTSLYTVSDIDTEEEYCNRPIDVFFNWGWSNPNRAELHAYFYQYAEELGYGVISDIRHWSGEKKDHPDRPLIVTAFTPHHSRFVMADMLLAQSMSKITISLNGCGVKCFRHSEASVNSLMALQENSLEWTYEWNEENAIILPALRHPISGVLPSSLSNALTDMHLIDPYLSIRLLLRLLKNPKHLYAKYLNCVETNKNYHVINYIDHILNTIENS